MAASVLTGCGDGVVVGLRCLHATASSRRGVGWRRRSRDAHATPTQANEDYFAKNGEPLFSSHMLDLSEDPLEENIATCVEYLERMSKSNLLLEMELGITGGEEDGVDNSDVDSSKLYTQPEEVWQVYEALSKVPNGKFTVAAAFGNVHGVYSPGNVRLEPQILHNTQKFISEKLGGDDKKPVYFVFHGLSPRPFFGLRRRRRIDASTWRVEGVRAVPNATPPRHRRDARLDAIAAPWTRAAPHLTQTQAARARPRRTSSTPSRPARSR